MTKTKDSELARKRQDGEVSNGKATGRDSRPPGTGWTILRQAGRAQQGKSDWQKRGKRRCSVCASVSPPLPLEVAELGCSETGWAVSLLTPEPLDRLSAARGKWRSLGGSSNSCGGGGGGGGGRRRGGGSPDCTGHTDPAVPSPSLSSSMKTGHTPSPPPP
ncbi:hypothetical protein D5F01_LYC10564 [Larimichthys crocea]|uniref:Uncharacterized protein n=1 Tax=Larimichthys crocea TaxID=215358 RepID=A0A6G0II94_LARCR|nr:hypothetical protein D5F01_LYC10564 [Larimichthys crocea]